MRKEGGLFSNLDWLVVFLYLILVALGWFNIYASVYDPVQNQSILDLSINSGKQLIFIGSSVILIIVILLLDFRVYETFATIFYALMIIMLGGVLIFGREINGAKAWYDLGFFRLQPAEFTKLATALILAKYVSITGVKLTDFRPQLLALLALALPIGLIQLQPDTGSLLVFAAFFNSTLSRRVSLLSILILGITVATLFILTLLVDKIPLLIGVGSLGLIIILFQLKQRRKIPFTLLILVAVGSFIFATDYILNEVNVWLPESPNRSNIQT